jgi:L-fuconolactonase
MMERMIDTHIHVWDLGQAKYSWLDGDTSILNRNYALEELEGVRAKAGVTEGILVQAAANPEDTDWMLRVAAGHDWITGVVGWLPLEDPEATARILEEKYVAAPGPGASASKLKGVRHLIHNETDPRWLLQLPVMESLRLLADRDLPYDLVGIAPAHIMTALKVAEMIPGLRMVFDHLNQPPIASGQSGEVGQTAGSGHPFGLWGELMREAARHKNFYAKISGLGTASGKGDNWTAADLEPCIGFALEHFGEDRCFCGGDWPVSLLAGSYEKTWSAYREIITGLLDEEGREKVFYKNAQRFYKI